jgi:glycosyl-4,4'-diaponeurosporenoate acyltransferase
MRIWYFSIFWTVVLDCVAWVVISLGVSAIMTNLRRGYFNPQSWIFRKRIWENDSTIYDNIFFVKTWKGILPDGAALFTKGFRKRRLKGINKDYVRTFVAETCRSEAVHWVTMAFAPVFFLWNPRWVGVVMIGYALLANLPCIVTQRYNRFRLERLLSKMGER